VGVQQMLPACREIVSIHHPAAVALVSVALRQRSWMVWPDTDAGSWTVEVM
jgi:hypothetical protein